MKTPFARWLVALAAGMALALLAVACGGDDDETDGTSPTATAQETPGGTGAIPAATDNCVPGNGPPSEGTGPDELTGRITFVRLVFGCQPDVYIMDGNGDNATALATDPSIDDESDLSPDGEKVVFFSGREGNAFIYVMNSDGSDLKRLTEGSGGDTSPRWSPDGKRIAFSRTGTLMVMNADGSDQKMIMEAQPADTAEPCRAGAFVGSWAPDGERITYYSAVIRSGVTNTFWVCSMKVDGSEIQVLVEEPKDKLHAEPYWSPDGSRIAFRDDRDGDCTASGACNYDIFVLNLDTGEQTNVTKHPSLDIEPAWSPDSEWIIFASNREDPNFDLYIIHPDGTGIQRLLEDPDAKDSYPSWR